MSPESIMNMCYQAMRVGLCLALPLLLAALVSGLIISILQAATQINESTLSFIPKALAVLFTLVCAGPWMLQIMMDYMKMIFSHFSTVIS